MKSKIFIGVDPGKAGALAVLESFELEPYSGRPDQVTILEVRPIPMIAAVHIPKGAKRKPEEREQYDIEAIAAWFRQYLEVTLVTVERSQPLPTVRMKSKQDGSVDTPMGGSLANFNRGVQRGFAWLLTALDIKFELVPPRTWQKVMHSGATHGAKSGLKISNTKDRSILAALRLFPGVDLRRTPRCTTAHDGIAEALLLAEFGRRTADKEKELDPEAGWPRLEMNTRERVNR